MPCPGNILPHPSFHFLSHASDFHGVSRMQFPPSTKFGFAIYPNLSIGYEKLGFPA